MLGQDIITKDYFTDLYGRIRKALEQHEEATQHYRPLLDGVRQGTVGNAQSEPTHLAAVSQQGFDSLYLLSGQGTL